MTVNETESYGINPELEEGHRFEVPFLVNICIIGFIGNLLVCMVYSQRRYRRSNASIYVLNLAAGDILALVVVVFHITEFFKPTWPFIWRSDWSCIVFRYLRFVGFNISIFTMVAIAIDRYFAICHPMKFKVMFTPRRTKFVVMSLWIIALITAVPTAFMFKAIYASSGQGITYKGKSPFACKLVLPFGDWFKDFKPIYLNILLFYLPVLITSLAYTAVVYQVWKSTHKMSGKIGDHNFSNSHLKTARILFIVFVAYAISYILLSTYNIISRYHPSYNMHPMIKNVGLLLPYANSCMNPIIYSFVDARFRRACVDILCCRQQKRRLDSTRTTRRIRHTTRAIQLSQYCDVSTQTGDECSGIENTACDAKYEPDQ
ncbi:allatostatin-A receptor-like [Glandiceps talaboti]